MGLRIEAPWRTGLHASRLPQRGEPPWGLRPQVSGLILTPKTSGPYTLRVLYPWRTLSPHTPRWILPSPAQTIPRFTAPSRATDSCGAATAPPDGAESTRDGGLTNQEAPWLGARPTGRQGFLPTGARSARGFTGEIAPCVRCHCPMVASASPQRPTLTTYAEATITLTPTFAASATSITDRSPPARGVWREPSSLHETENAFAGPRNTPACSRFLSPLEPLPRCSSLVV